MCQTCALTQNFDPTRHYGCDGHTASQAFPLLDQANGDGTVAAAASNIYGTSWGPTRSTLGDAGGVVTYSIAGAGFDLSRFGQGNIDSVDGSEFYSDIDYETEIANAFAQWSDHADIEFVQVEDGGGDAGSSRDGDIRIFFGPIPGGTIGLAFYPSFGSSAIAGDIMLDDVNNINVFRALLLHEIGHALGLEHVPNGTDSVMTPVVGLSSLTSFDINSIQQVYGVQDDAPPELTMRSSLEDFDLVRGLEDLTVNGNALDNRITGTDFGETLNGEDGRDTLLGHEGDDVLDGGQGNDSLDGGTGFDSIEGGNGNDLIFGGGFYDTLNGGAGNDTIAGDNGGDLVDLGAGNDVFNDNSQSDIHGRDTVFGGLGDDTINGGGGNDLFYGDDGFDVIEGGDGNDLIFGGGWYDTLSGGAGDDTVTGGNGRDFVTLGEGHDVFNDNGQSDINGRDTVFGGIGDDTINGDGGNDVLYGDDGFDVIEGGGGNDLIFGGSWYDTLSGGAGNDTITGGNGGDLVDLGAGNDVFNDNSQSGVNGQDTITGGSGSDTFVFGDMTSEDVVTDFQVGLDRLAFSATVIGGRDGQAFTDDFATVTAQGVLIEIGAGRSVLLEGLTTTAGLSGDIYLQDDLFT